MTSNSSVASKPLLTADGIPLKVSLQRSMRRNKLRAIGLVLPPLLFLLLLFIIPIGNLLTRSVDDQLINYQMPLTFRIIEKWDRQSLPEEELFDAMSFDLATINKLLITNNSGTQVDPDDPGWRVKIPKRGPYKEPILQINPIWGEVETWLPLSKIVQSILDNLAKRQPRLDFAPNWIDFKNGFFVGPPFRNFHAPTGVIRINLCSAIVGNQ